MIGRLIRLNLPRRLVYVFAAIMAATMIPFVLLPPRVIAFGLPQLLCLTLVLSGGGRLNLRATLFEAALPIAPRQLFWSRILPRTTMVWLVALCWMLIAAVRIGPGSPAIWYTAEGAVGITLAILLPYTLRPNELAVPSKVARVLVIPLLVVATVISYFLPPALAFGLLAAAACATFVAAWKALPRSYQTAPLRTQVRHEPALSDANSREAGTYWRPMFRSAVSWETVFFLVFYSVPGAVGMFYGWLIYRNAAAGSRMRLRWMAGLPLSYRTLLLATLGATVLPVLVGVSIGVGIQRNVRDLSVLGNGPSKMNGHYDFGPTRVPLTFWKVTQSASPPPVQSPWGETIIPAAFSVGTFTIYNPFTTTKASSERFVAWQWERAAAVVYGKPIPYSARDTDSTLPVTQRPRIMILKTATLLVFLLYIALLGELSRWHQLLRPGRRRLRIAFGLLCWAPFIVALVADFGFSMVHSGQLVIPVTEILLLRLLDVLPQNMSIVVVVAVAPVAAMYWLLERQFAKSELPKLFVLPKL